MVVNNEFHQLLVLILGNAKSERKDEQNWTKTSYRDWSD